MRDNGNSGDKIRLLGMADGGEPTTLVSVLIDLNCHDGFVGHVAFVNLSSTLVYGQKHTPCLH